MEISGSRLTTSSLFRFIPSPCSNLVFSFLMEDVLFILVVVEHFNVDSKGIVEVIVMSGSDAEEFCENADNLGEDIQL